jgi:hypothetical protein
VDWVAGPEEEAAEAEAERHCDGCAAAGGNDGGGHWQVCFDDDTDCQAEKIWLATGSRMDGDTDPLLQSVLRAHPVELHRGFPEIVSRPFSSWSRPMLTEIDLCHAWSCHEILRGNTARQGPTLRWAEGVPL